MNKINWTEKLGWTEEQIEDLRYTGYAYIRQGKYDIALTFFDALTVLDPNSLYDTQMVGAIYLQLGQPAKSLPFFEKALKIEGDHSSTLINLSKALFMLGRVSEGVQLAKVLQKEPNKSISNMAKALILAYS